MKQQEVFKKIGTIIKELNEQYDYLATTEGQLNDLELELFVANAHFLTDHSEVLRKLNAINVPAVVPKPEIIKEEKYFEPVVQQASPAPEKEPETEEKEAVSPLPDTTAKVEEDLVTDQATDDKPTPHIDLTANGADDDFSYTRHEPETIRHELNLEDIPNWEDEEDEVFVNEELTGPEEEKEEEKEAVEEEEKTPPVVEPAKPEPREPVAERLPVEAKAAEKQEEPLTINQRMSAQLSNTGGSRITEKLHASLPVTDLKTAVSLNDKLLYIKDLFNGYNLAYSEAIEILNRFSTFEEADEFLQKSYAVKNNWAGKQTTADKFHTLLKRRYL